MDHPEPTRDEVERSFRQLLRDGDLAEPDEVLPHEDGGIICRWHEPKLAVIVDLDEQPGADYALG